jgi:hypothetical protein
MMGRVSEPEMPRAAPLPKLPHSPHSGIAAASQARQERVNVAAGGKAIVGAVTHTSRDRGSPENEDQPYGTEHERADEPAADTSVRREEVGRLAVPEASGQGADTLPATRRRSRQRRTKG